MAMVQMFVSEWQTFSGAVHDARRAEHARLQRKWVRKQIGLTIVAAGAAIVLLHGLMQTMV